MAMAKDAGAPLRRLRVDGGASRNDLMMQFQSDLLDVSIDRPDCVETTALGAAYLAGLALGVFADLDAIRRVHSIDKSFDCAMMVDDREQHLARWHLAVSRTLSKSRKS